MGMVSAVSDVLQCLTRPAGDGLEWLLMVAWLATPQLQATLEADAASLLLC